MLKITASRVRSCPEVDLLMSIVSVVRLEASVFSDRMPTYNTRDAKGTTDELDPCIAAEIRVKNNSPKRYALSLLISNLYALLEKRTLLWSSPS